MENGACWREFVHRHKHWIKPIIRHKLVLSGLSSIYSSDLSALARLFGTDKLAHGYIPRYQSLLAGMRKKKFKLLEIGIGGYEGQTAGGESLRMWKAYFPHAHIHGLDILDKSEVEENRITVWQGSQVDPAILNHIHSSSGGFDVIIDDGSHRNEHIIATFEILFPLLNSGGVYFVEDIQTSYWPEYGGKPVVHDSTSQTAMGYFKTLTDGTNHEEFRISGYTPSYMDKNIDSISFWHNLIAIRKCD